VFFYDIKKQILDKLGQQGYNTTDKLDKKGYDIFWVCTAEWNTEQAVKDVLPLISDKAVLVVRSTVLPGTTKQLKDKYKIRHIVHNPEFLRERTAIDDMFHPDRIVIGTDSDYARKVLAEIYRTVYSRIVFTDSTTSETVKLASNCWLATQISYWNEVKRICDVLNINPQEVANICTLDGRISRYGSSMFGTPYGGFCLPKDMEAFSNLFKEKKIQSDFLALVSKTNKEIQ